MKGESRREYVGFKHAWSFVLQDISCCHICLNGAYLCYLIEIDKHAQPIQVYMFMGMLRGTTVGRTIVWWAATVSHVYDQLLQQSFTFLIQFPVSGAMNITYYHSSPAVGSMAYLCVFIRNTSKIMLWPGVQLYFLLIVTL